MVDFSNESVTSIDELRDLIGVPHEHVIKKEISILDEHCQKFISMSPLFFLSTSSADGTCDVTPRGDMPSKVLILNQHQFVIPERPGNKRVDSLQNILSNPYVGIVFLIPGLEEVLRVNGKATIVKDKALLEQMSLNGRPPLLGIGVDVESCYIHCSRALKKAKIWNYSTWESQEALPSGADIFLAHLTINGVDLKK